MHHRSTIVGRLTRNPEMRIVNQGQTVTKIRIAASRNRQVNHDGEENQWEDFDKLYIDVECWGDLARNVACSLQKGTPVICVGHLVTNEWVGEQGKSSRIIMKASYIGMDMSRHVLSAQYSRSTIAEIMVPAEQVAGIAGAVPAQGDGDVAGASPSVPADSAHLQPAF
ncbi:MAG: single-stranded DNA-binding protein [Corynebacterium sp.]|nr:single-stranded DNA-binding protein [Corynebacterium sp.]